MGGISNIIPVVLCSGRGSRLWPLSSPQTPKHFLHFGCTKTLFQQTVQRCAADNYDRRPIVVSNSAHREFVFNQLEEINVKADLCLEPEGKNSCPAIIFACFLALQRNQNPTLLILPSDHQIEPADHFNHIVSRAAGVCESHLLTFGIQPDSPQSGYGYIQAGNALFREGDISVSKVTRFIEKPNACDAQKFCDNGYLWSAGMFLLNAKLFLAELKRLQPELLKLAAQAFDMGRLNDGALEIDPILIKSIPSISVDIAVLERSYKVAVCPVQIIWRDIGNWDRAASMFPSDNFNNKVEGNVEFCESSDNFVHSPFHRTCLVGVDNLAVVVTRDAVLVSHRAKCEMTGLMANRAEEPDIKINMYPEVDHRPWGEFQRIDLGEGYQVKRLRVESGQSLSLQSHYHRAEHWIVVSGKAEVTISGVTTICNVDESVYIPKGSVHRLANKFSEPLILIEVQTGNYLGEDDIVRIDDVYDRVKK
jgi:mannose-1-phosphate guanylyltransferase/mannose-6-phosphate isomerase